MSETESLSTVTWNESIIQLHDDENDDLSMENWWNNWQEKKSPEPCAAVSPFVT
jgi:hypothetical protein